MEMALCQKGPHTPGSQHHPAHLGLCPQGSPLLPRTARITQVLVRTRGRATLPGTHLDSLHAHPSQHAPLSSQV